jgi:glycosyltransferase involved in cell wall biosynthesis
MENKVCQHRLDRVLMVTGVYPPDINGAVLQAKMIVESLCDSYDFKVLTSPLRVPHCVAADPNVFRLLDFSSAFKVLKTLFYLVVFLEHHRFQIIHFHGFSRKVFPIACLGKLFGAKLLLKHSSLGIDDIQTLRSRGVLSKILTNWFDAFVAPAPAFLVPHLNLKRRCYLIPNGVDTARFYPLEDSIRFRGQRQELGISNNAFVVLGVGHFSVEKRLVDIIEAVMLIPKNVKPFSILLIGSMDPDHFEVSREVVARLESLQRQADLFIDIRIIDRAVNIEKFMQIADVYVLSSEREGMPNSLLEAMACGVPVVSTVLPGITDWVISDKQDGLLFRVGRRAELAARINEIYCSDERSNILGRSGRDRILCKFSAQATVQLYRSLYRDLTSKHADVR